MTLTTRRNLLNTLSIDDALHRLDGVDEIQVPAFPILEVEKFLLDRYKISGRLTPLQSEVDQMFRCDVRQGEEYIVRIFGPLESPETLEFQGAILRGVAQSDPELPIPRPVLSSREVPVEYLGPENSKTAVRVFTCLDGVPIKQTRTSLAQRQLLGKTLARLDKALATVSHPAITSNTKLGDLRTASLLRPLVELLQSESQRRVLNAVLDEGDMVVKTRMPYLRQQIIHADYTRKNVLVNAHDENQITGIIDFGDALKTALAAEIAFAICRYPLEEATQMFAAYHSVNPLSKLEIETIYYLVCVRLCMASLIQTWRASRDDSRSAEMDMAGDEVTGLLDAIRSVGHARTTQIFFDACELSAG